MMKRLLFIASLALGVASVHAATTISNVISPVSVVISSGKAREVVTLPGKPVFFCGLQPFIEWAAPLVGQPVRSAPDTGITVTIDGRDVSLEQLLADRGWLQPPVLSDDAQAAVTEGRGGWACAPTVAPFELLQTSVDPKVLAGIALNESAYNGRPWPWTLNIAGQGLFFKSRMDAYKAIEMLIARGRCDFDVGLLQINWCFHGKRFASAWDALAPATNVRVAEQILNENYARTGSVEKAIAYYHSANPTPGRAYLARFVRHLSMIEASR